VIHLILLLGFISIVVRIVTAPFRFRRRRYWNGYGGYGYGYNPYAYGCRRRHGMLGGLLPIIVLVALDRMFGGRRF